MMWLASLCSSVRRAALALGVTIAPLSMAAATSALSPSILTECLGYFTVQLPGAFSYALARVHNSSLVGFADDGLGTWGTELRLRLIDLEEQELSISQPAGPSDLNALIELKNERQLAIKRDLLRKANLFTAPDLTRDDLLREAASVDLFKTLGTGRAIGAMLTAEKLALHALVNSRLLSTELKPRGTPEQTLDTLLGHYKPRALGEVPAGPGVCVPYGFFTGEKQPATIGLNIRLKDHPDIVVYLLASDAASSRPWNPEEYIDRKTEPMSMFYASRGAVAMNRLRPYQRVSIDGQEGLGAFVNVKRDVTLLQPVHNPVADNTDWGYLAYIPGRAGGKPGESFNITFKVERFGRFAQRPMTEREFRDLTLRIAASIKRRPGAWVAP